MNLKLSIFADASHGNLSDGGCQLGYLIMLVGDDGNYTCSLLDGIDVMISTEQPIVHYLNSLRLINKLSNLTILSR